MKTRFLFHGAVIFLLLFAILFTGINGSRATYTFTSLFPDPVTIQAQTLVRYQIDPAQSQFMVRAFRGGLLYFKGHDHFIKVGDFSGEVQITPNIIDPATLTMTIKSDSLEETDSAFTAEQKQIINKELDEIVLESAKYPEITFRSTGVTGKLNGTGYDAKITGDITLHGVTKSIRIPATVTFDGDVLRAKGEFTLDRKDFNVNATNAFHGAVRIKHELKFTFDIVARRS